MLSSPGHLSERLPRLYPGNLRRQVSARNRAQSDRKLALRVQLALATAAGCLQVTHMAPFPTGAAVGPGTKKGVTTEVVTGSKSESGIGPGRILTVGKVQGRHDDTENAPGAETGRRTGPAHGTGNGPETDTASLC